MKKTVRARPAALFAVLAAVVASADVAAARRLAQTGITVSGPGCARIPPSAPSNLKAYPGDGRVELTWQEPSNGACVDQYEIAVKDLTAQYLKTSADSSRYTQSFEVVIEDLINGHEYEFTVTAKSDAVSGANCPTGADESSYGQLGSWWNPGDGSNEPTNCWDTPNAVATVRATPEAPYNQLPGPPASIYARSHDSKVTLSWDAPADDGGCEITGYSVEVIPLVNTLAYMSPEKRFTLDYEVVIEDLINCQEYRFEVRAENCIGLGPAKSVLATPVPTSLPTIVTSYNLGTWCP